MKRGISNINNLKRGLTDVNKVYRGSNLVWERIADGFPLWTDNDIDTSVFLSALSNYTSTKSFDPSVSTTFGSLASTQAKWFGGVLAENGDIFCIPLNTNQVLRINTSNNTTTLFGSLSGEFRSVGGVLAPNGFIYAAPHAVNYFYKINTTNNTVSTFGTVPNTNAGGNFNGLVVGKNGKIYYVPHSNQNIVICDPSNDSMTSFQRPIGPQGAYFRSFDGGISVNGFVYFVPSLSPVICELNESTNEVIYYGTLGTTQYKWSGAVLAPNGKIYMIPQASTQVLEFDPVTKEIVLFNSAGNGYQGGTLGPNGKIYCMPYNTSNRTLEIDPVTRTTQFVGPTISTPSSSRFGGTVLASNGMMYSVPWNAQYVLRLGVEQVLDSNFTLSRYINKPY
jgi:streptogramin lyase